MTSQINVFSSVTYMSGGGGGGGAARACVCVLLLKLNFSDLLTMPTKLLLNAVAVWQQICGDLNRT